MIFKQARLGLIAEMVFFVRLILSVFFALSLAVGPAWAAPPDLAGFVPVPQLWLDGRFIIAPNKLWLASALGGERRVQIVDMATGTILRTLDTPPAPPGSAEGSDPHVLAGLAITADSTAIVARLADGSTVAWNVATGARLPSSPAGLVIPPLQPIYEDKDTSAFKIALARDGNYESTAGIVEITSITKTIEPIRFRAPNLWGCGVGADLLTFDGEYLVFRLYPGEGDGLSTPAIAYKRENGSFHEIWRAPCEAAGHDGGGALLNNGAFFEAFKAPVGSETVWNLASNQVAARFDNMEGNVAISADGQTMVAAAYADDVLTRRVFSVLQDGKKTAFLREIKDFDSLFLSPNGRWLALSGNGATSVWSIPSGIPKPGSPEAFEASGITNDGLVVETSKQRDDEDFHGHRIEKRSSDGRWLLDTDGDVFDASTGRIVAWPHDGHVEGFTRDGHAIIVTSTAAAWRMVDLATGRPLWTLQITPDVHGYIMTFPDGCVQVSPGADRLVRLVRGFESRPFDAAASAAFTKPGCKGVPEVMAASEAAFAADRKQVEARAKADADEQARLAAEAAAQARQEAAARQAWIAGAPAREAEERERARLVSKAIVTVAGAAPYAGTAKWHFSHNFEDGDAVASIEVPTLRFHTLIAIDKSPKAGMDQTVVVTILYRPNPESSGPSVAGVATTAGAASESLHIALHLGGPSGLKYLSFLPRLDPPDGEMKLDRLRPETWLDISLVMNDLKRATLSVEIGAAGREVIDTAMAFKAAHP